MKKITWLLFSTCMLMFLLAPIALANNNDEIIYTAPSQYPQYTANTYAQPNDIANAKIRENHLDAAGLTPEQQKAYYLGLLFSGAVNYKNYGFQDCQWTEGEIIKNGFTLKYNEQFNGAYAVGKRTAKDGSVDYVIAFDNMSNDAAGIAAQLSGAYFLDNYFGKPGNNNLQVHGAVNTRARSYAANRPLLDIIASVKGKANNHIYFTGYAFGGSTALLVGINAVENLGLTKEQVTIVPIADPAIGVGCMKKDSTGEGGYTISTVQPADTYENFVDTYRNKVNVYRATRQSDILMKLLDCAPLTLRHFGNVIVDAPDTFNDGDIRDAHTFNAYTDFIKRVTGNYHQAMKELATVEHTPTHK